MLHMLDLREPSERGDGGGDDCIHEANIVMVPWHSLVQFNTIQPNLHTAIGLFIAHLANTFL